MKLREGESVGRFVLLHMLGRGGMGVVYAAYDTALDRKVAIKVLRPDHHVAKRKRRTQRLLREAQSMARLSHPNVITVHDVGVRGQDVFIAMEFIQGITLGQWLRTPRSTAEIVAVFCAAGKGLAAAHAAGMIHRDFKPENVLVGDDGRVCITDFGIAFAATVDDSGAREDDPSRAPSAPALAVASSRDLPETLTETPDESADSQTEDPEEDGVAGLDDAAADLELSSPPPPRARLSAWRPSSAPLTHTAAVLGTVGYMAPEQVHGERTDARADQFAFCVSLYVALFGQKPFESNTLAEYQAALSAGPARTPPRGSKVPSPILAAVLRGLERVPSARHASMHALLDELARDRSRVRRGAALVAIVAVVVAGGIGSQMLRSDRCPREATELVRGPWNETTRGRIHDAFVATRSPAAETDFTIVARVLDEYAGAWKRVYVPLCEEARPSPADAQGQASLRVDCARAAIEELTALTDALSSADRATVANAVEAAHGLPPPELCLGPLQSSVGVPADPVMRAKVLDLRRRIAHAQSASNTGKLEDGVTLARSARDDARALGHAGTETSASFALGKALHAVGRNRESIAALEDTVWSSERGGDDATRALAAATIAHQLEAGGATEEVTWWFRLSNAAAERSGRADVKAQVLGLEADATSWEHPEEGVDDIKQAIKLLEGALGPHHLRTLAMHRRLASFYIGLGQFGAARDELSGIMAALSGTTAEVDPARIRTDYALAVSRIGLGEYRDAISLLDRTRTNATASGDAETQMQASHDLCLAWTSLGEPGRGLLHGQEAIRLYEEGGRQHWWSAAGAYAYTGQALVALGRHREAIDACETSRTMMGKWAPDQVYVFDALTCLGEARLGLHDAGAALPLLEESVQLHRRMWKGDLARSRFALARTLTLQGRDPARARSLAEAARDELVELPFRAPLLADVRAWLAALPPR